MPDYESDPNKIIYGNLDGYSVSKGVSLNTDLALTNGFKALAGVTIMDVSVTENGERFRQLLTESVQGVWSVGYTFKQIRFVSNISVKKNMSILFLYKFHNSYFVICVTLVYFVYVTITNAFCEYLNEHQAQPLPR